MLRALGVDAKALREEFPEDIDDIDLFEQLRGRDVTFVAADLAQLRRKFEARALQRAAVSAIYFGPFY